MKTYRHSRFLTESVTATMFALTTAITAIWPSWIEPVLYVDPDSGDGVTEWAIVAIFGVTAIVLAVLAQREHRRLVQTAQ